MFRIGDLVSSKHYQIKGHVVSAYKTISVVETFDGKKYIASNEDITLEDLVTEEEQLSCFSGE